MRFRSALSIGFFILLLVLFCFRAVREQICLLVPWIVLFLSALGLLIETILYKRRTSRLRREGKTKIAEITRVHYGPDFHIGAGLGGKKVSADDVWAMQTVSFHLKDDEGRVYTTPLLIFTGTQEFHISLGSAAHSQEISIRKRVGRKARVFVNPNNCDDYFVDPRSL